MPDKTMIIRRILRVNHSGEHGAVAIYSTQIERAKQHYPEILPWLEETLSHELRHRQAFQDAMPSRGAKPCRAMYVWRFGGCALGAITAMFGKSGVMVCTAAVERTVHKHLMEQIGFLQKSDPELAGLVEEILEDENAHLAEAERQHNPNAPNACILSFIIAIATELLILISTRGDSIRLRKQLRTV